jgi:hypothetical protein
MKKILILTIALLSLSSCYVIQPTNRIVKTYLVDYRPYISDTFFISPDPYTGDFEPIGEIMIEVIPALKERKGIAQYQDELYSYGVTPEIVPMNDLIHEAFKQAAELHANAIVNFKIQAETHNIITAQGLFTTTTAPITKYIITGFCIERK